MSTLSKNTIHPFETPTASAKLTRPVVSLVLFISTIVIGGIIARGGIIGVAGIFGLVVIGTYLYCIFQKPILGLYTAVALCFILIGVGRYVKDVQVGLGMDAILILTYIALFFNKFKEKINWAPANKDITLLSAIWFAYSLFQIINPEARSFEAWFSGRSIGIYMMLIVPLTLLFINTNKKLDYIFYIWSVFSILASCKGILQIKMGVDHWEQGWLDEGNYKTHVLFGKLRAFSFLSDAGQFGANQAYSAGVATIMCMTTKSAVYYHRFTGFLWYGYFGNTRSAQHTHRRLWIILCIT